MNQPADPNGYTGEKGVYGGICGVSIVDLFSYMDTLQPLRQKEQ
jgi:hypothetical protein